MKTMTPKQVRKIVTNKYGAGFIAVLTLSGSGTSLMQVAHAETNSGNGEVTQKASTKSSPDYTAVDKKIADAKKKGMTIAEKTNTVKVKTTAERDAAMKKAEAESKTQQEKLDKQIAEYGKWSGSSTGLEGLNPNQIKQQLILEKSPNAKMTISNVASGVETRKLTQDKFGEISSNIANGKGVIKSQEAMEFAKKASGPAGVSGKLGTATFTDGVKGSYGGKKITKIVYDFYDLEKNNTSVTDQKPRFYAFNDYTDTIWLNNTEGVTIDPHYYGEDGKELDFDKNTAYISFGSLNSRYSETNTYAKLTKKGKAHHVESVQLKGGGTLTKLQGSTIQVHGNDAYADVTNQSNGQTLKDKVIPERWEGWDTPTDPKRIVGAVAANLEGKGTKIRFHTTREGNADGVSVWGTMSTTVAPSLPAPKGEFTKTVVELEPGAITKPVKTRVDQNGNAITSKDVKIGDTISYGLKTTFPTVDAKGNPIKNLSIVDPYIDAFTYKSSKVHLTDAKGKDVTSDFTIKDDKGGKQHQVSWTPKDPKKYAGKTVHVVPTEFTINSTADLSKYEKDGHLVFPNTVYMTVNGEKVPGNTVEITPKGEETPIKKAFVADISKWNLHKINVEEANPEKSGDSKASASNTEGAKSQTTDTKASSTSSAKGTAVDEKGASKTSENASTDGKATSSTSAKAATTTKTAPVTADTKATATSQTDKAADKSTQSTAAETSTVDKQTATSEKPDEKQNAGTASDKTEDSKATSTNKVKKGQKYGYTLNTTIDTIDKDGKLINSFGFNDPLEKALAVDGAQLIDHTDKDKDITKDFKFSGKVKATLNSDKLAGLRGHKVEMRVGVHVDENQDLSAYKQADGTYLIKNVAEKEQNGKTTPSNRVDVTLDKDPEKPAEPKKEVPKQPEKPSKPQEVAANTGEDTVLNRIVDWVKNLF